MASLLFSIIYNISLTVILTLAASCVFFLYCRYKRPLLIAICIMFAVYLLDNTIVFCTEVVPEFGGIYDRMFLDTPSIKTIYFVTLLGCLLYALHCVIPAFTLRHMGFMIGTYAALLVCVPMISRHTWMVFVYYFITQVLIIGISLWGLVALRNKESSFDRGMLKRIFLYFLCMSALVLAEDSFVIFFKDQFYGPWLKINNRNFSENLMYLGLSWPIFRYTVRQLRHHPSEQKAEELSVPADPKQEQPPQKLQVFSAAHKLTEREQEILNLLLQSKSQQEISDELLIAPGTVKTHTHNIYQKIGSTNRKQVIAKYQEFCDLQLPISAGSGAEPNQG